MKKLHLILLGFMTLGFVACETCSDCEYTYTNSAGESVTVTDDFCSEDTAEVDAFEASFELDAVSNGTMATCTR